MKTQDKLQTLGSLKASIACIEKGSHQESLSFKKDPIERVTEEASKLDDPQKAYEKILRVLGFKDRSTFELRNKLLEDGYSTEAVEQALERAVRLGLVNDARYLETQIEMKFRSGKGKRAAAHELLRKGFSQEEIDSQIENSSYSEEDEEARAYQFLLTHAPRGKNLRESAFRKLVNKGYSINAASKVARKYCENQL